MRPTAMGIVGEYSLVVVGAEFFVLIVVLIVEIE